MTKEIVPLLDDALSLDQNFEVFLSWSQSIQDPVEFAASHAESIPHRDHAIGFTCYYLTKSRLYIARFTTTRKQPKLKEIFMTTLLILNQLYYQAHLFKQFMGLNNLTQV